MKDDSGVTEFNRETVDRQCECGHAHSHVVMSCNDCNWAKVAGQRESMQETMNEHAGTVHQTKGKWAIRERDPGKTV